MQTQQTIRATADLFAFERPENGRAAAVFNLLSNTGKPATAADASTAIAAALGNQMVVVADTLRTVQASGGNSVVSCVVTTEPKVATFHESETPAEFVAVAKNLFMNSNEAKAYRVVASDNGRITLQRDAELETDEEVHRLMSQRRPMRATASAAARNLLKDIDARQLALANAKGALATYVTDDNTLGLGVIVQSQMRNNGAAVASNMTTQLVPMTSGSKGTVEVPTTLLVDGIDSKRAQVRETCKIDQQCQSALASASPVNMVARQIEYYDMLRSMNPEFFDRLLDISKGNGLDIPMVDR